MFTIPENKSWVVYGIRLNQENSIYRYVGLTTTKLKSRFATHKSDAKEGSSPVNRWLRKHEDVGFIVEIISHVSVGDIALLEEEEIFWIATFRRLLGDRTNNSNSMLNIDDGGNYSSPSEDTRAKISKTLLEYYDDPEVVRKIRETSIDRWTDDRRVSWSGEGNPAFGKRGEECHNYGLVRSDETRAKMSESMLGVPKVRGQLTCLHCGLTGNSSMITRFHMDNCHLVKAPEILVCPHCGKSGAGVAAMKQHHFDNCAIVKPRDQKTCPHCSKVGAGSVMKRWHFEKCKSLSTRSI